MHRTTLGFISAIDLRTREVRWSRPFGTGYDSGPLGIASKLRFEIGTRATPLAWLQQEA